MRPWSLVLVTLLSSALLLGCGSSEHPEGGDGPSPVPEVPTAKTRYDLANGCWALKSRATDGWCARNGSGYAMSAATAKAAEPFFLKPTALGKYMVYGKDRSFLTGDGSAVTTSTALAEPIDWTIDGDLAQGYTLYSASEAGYLSTGTDGSLSLATSAGDAAKFDFEWVEGCSDFPEVSTNTLGETFKGSGEDQPVLGFADVHVHISATDFLGGAHYGYPYSRFGVEDAVGSCQAKHGPNGRLDLVGNLYAGTPEATHDNIGWPSFIDWPAAHSLTHEAMYYKWVERAWKAGLRLMVNNLVENEVLCFLASTSQLQPLKNCNEMDSAVSQAGFMYRLQDYIDAQEGGPGKGWYRIVTSPQEARKVINEGKMAVVLGIEISHLFNCNVRYLANLTEVSGCTEADIDEQMDRLYDLGVRQMFPIHEFDNAFGGNGIFDGAILNVGNFVDTGKFWGTYDCPEDDYLYGAGAIMTTVPGLGNDPLTALLLPILNGAVPLYNSSKLQCNSRSMTNLGEYAFKKMMEKKMIIEVDHLELKIKTQLLDIAEAQTPVYPLVSTHGGHGGISMAQAQRILAGGGLIYPYKGNGKQHVDMLNRLKPIKSDKYLFALGYGADTNGMGSQANPRGSEAVPVSYPFTLFQGSDWGSQFAKVAPVTFDEQVSGERAFDINAEGMAHYGLVADFVEEVRLEGGKEALDALYNSAEGYLQMWERTLNR